MTVSHIINKTLRQNYSVDKTLTAGIVLTGSEVKSIRQNGCSIGNSFCYVNAGELFIRNMHIPKYKFANQDHDTDREKKLLVKRREIHKLVGDISRKGYSLVPAEIFFNKKGLLKVVIAIAEGKKLIDKRREIMRKDNQKLAKNNEL